jgi:[ribosomal protein S18]-alanine N-acetyltransferase
VSRARAGVDLFANGGLHRGLALRTMTVTDLDEVLVIEAGTYGHPWSRGNFIDSLAAGYLAQALICPQEGLIGYFVAMPGAGELHLLNLTVHPAWQGRGHARQMLDAIEGHCRQQPWSMLWLEVRAGNQRALALYRQRGFVEVGVRRDYYPASLGRREDAIVMRLTIGGGAGDGLD